MNYDTLETRRAARELDAVSGDVSHVAGNDLARMLRSLSGSFEGDAAEVLNRQLNDLSRDLNRLSGGLDQIAAALRAYARHLEELDRQMAQGINGGG